VNFRRALGVTKGERSPTAVTSSARSRKPQTPAERHLIFRGRLFRQTEPALCQTVRHMPGSRHRAPRVWLVLAY